MVDGNGLKTPTVLGAITEKTRSFGREQAGTVGIIFALTSLAVIWVVGGAVDYGRAVTVRDQLQHAVDASVLAATRVYQTEKDSALAIQKGIAHFDKNKPQSIASTATFDTSKLLSESKLMLNAQAHVPAPFLAVRDTKHAITIEVSSEATLAVGGNSELNLEISLMLDVTGSMGGNKLRDLKAAAKDLIDIVVWDDQSEYTSKVALVPFAARVNVGPYASAMTGLPPTRTVTTTTGSKKKKKTVTSTEYLIECVTDRWGMYQHSDDAPAGPNGWVGPYDGTADADLDDQYQENSGACSQPSAQIMPLNSNKAVLKAHIDSFVANGMTAGSLGTEMAWFMISPKWAHIWPAASAPQPYHTDKLQKIAVLMTDGEYNFYKGQNWSAASVSAFAKSTCHAMKQAGVTVYTVGFQLPNNRARDVMSSCASDSSKYYDAADGDALRQAFRDIALQLAKLRLTQ